ncbi:AraC family transcriptional regulator [Ferrimonas sediminicola]|uniref:AraC family transcriptional regulator n=1 Tax=Ferrimonas sediminicola TaxID=2569538 RepID=A0A4U1BC26_9GAMM|nr:AraC family transcriptional regulator [Ferrimonas sediminicola]TKB48511.1 AraC family transcriptional regulator [Ferrimonas sediminicola]
MGEKRYPLDARWRYAFERLGLDAGTALSRAGLSPEVLANPDSRLTTLQYLGLWRSLEQSLAPGQLSQSVAQFCSSTFTAPMMAALCCPTLLDAIRRVERFKPLLGPQRLRVEESENRVTIRQYCDPDALTLPNSLVVLEWHLILNLAQMATKVDPIVVSLTLPEACPEGRQLADSLGLELTLGEGNALVLPKGECQRPFMTLNDAMWQHFEPALLAQIRTLHAQGDFASEVKAILLECLPSGMVDKERVASRLGISPSTLKRRLGAEKRPFKELLAETRKELACHYLQQCHLCHTEISLLLGFDDPTSFYRACQRWFGLTPEGIKNKQAGIVPAW